MLGSWFGNRVELCILVVRKVIHNITVVWIKMLQARKKYLMLTKKTKNEPIVKNYWIIAITNTRNRK